MIQLCSGVLPRVTRERLDKTLNFDNYKEKFSMLLHIEELQMQKDIRNYDMKGIEFQQDRTDRRFLILEVSLFRRSSEDFFFVEIL